MLELTKKYKDDFVFEYKDDFVFDMNYALYYKPKIHLPLKFVTLIQFRKNGKVFFVKEIIEFKSNYKLKNIYYKLEK